MNNKLVKLNLKKKKKEEGIKWNQMTSLLALRQRKDRKIAEGKNWIKHWGWRKKIHSEAAQRAGKKREKCWWIPVSSQDLGQIFWYPHLVLNWEFLQELFYWSCSASKPVAWDGTAAISRRNCRTWKILCAPTDLEWLLSVLQWW